MKKYRTEQGVEYGRKEIVMAFKQLDMWSSDSRHDGLRVRADGGATYCAGYFYHNRERDARITRKLVDAGLMEKRWTSSINTNVELEGDFEVEDHFNAWPRDSWMQWSITPKGVAKVVERALGLHVTKAS